MFNSFRLWFVRLVLPSGYKVAIDHKVPAVSEIKQLWKKTIKLGEKRVVKYPNVLAFRVDGQELTAAEGEADAVLAEICAAAAAVRERIQQNREERSANTQD